MALAAAIDIGSNSLLLSIAERVKSDSADSLRLVRDECTITGLSKGITKTGKISEDRLSHSLETLQDYRELLDEHKVDQFQIVATEALRRASNGDPAKKQMEEVLRAPVELISGEREAELSFWGVQKEFPYREAQKIVFDIGGASTELCHGSSKGISNRVSLKIGSVLLTEKFGLDSRSERQPAFDYVLKLLDSVEWREGAKNSLGLGVAGTITTLMSVHNKISEYSRDKVHGKSIGAEDVDYWTDEILSRSLEDRARIIGLPANRADIFGGGLTILSALIHYFDWPEIYCMDSGVRFGLLYEMLEL